MFALDFGFDPFNFLWTFVEAMALLATVFTIDSFHSTWVVGNDGKLFGLFRLLKDCIDH